MIGQEKKLTSMDRRQRIKGLRPGGLSYDETDQAGGLIFSRYVKPRTLGSRKYVSHGGFVVLL